MNASLTDKLEAFVNRLVDEGRYRSASEVVREGLEALGDPRSAASIPAENEKRLYPMALS